MILFKKKEPDIDFTLLQKRGIIKKAKEKKLPFKINKDGMIELIQQNNIPNELINKSISSDSLGSGMAANPFGFLGSIVSGNNDKGEQSYYGNNETDTGNDDSSKKLNSVKIKLDDLEYKLEKFLERLSMIEAKLENFERKT